MNTKNMFNEYKQFNVIFYLTIILMYDNVIIKAIFKCSNRKLQELVFFDELNRFIVAITFGTENVLNHLF